jgi:hypothetical protein
VKAGGNEQSLDNMASYPRRQNSSVRTLVFTFDTHNSQGSLLTGRYFGETTNFMQQSPS